MKRILLIEDDEDIALSLRYNLERDGAFEITSVRDGEAGLEAAAARLPDLVLLDLSLPGLDGIEVCRRLRSSPATARIPIVMITARVEESQRVRGLDEGADDYITKPFSLREVQARVRAVLRRAEGSGGATEALADPPLAVDLDARRAVVGGREVVLTRREFDLLADLLRHRGRVRTRERLLERVWGYDYPGETRTVDVHVRRLRQKLGPEIEARIETVVGVGYRWRGTS
ncbi:MAG: response regulator transcription factor [Acidobacteriia bacterium]|nr:response regulator transcription factor [Terriglobia bacterium]